MATSVAAREILEKALEQKERLPAGRQGPIVLALHGELGAGKTTFVQALARELGITDEVRSPTFLLIRVFKLPEPRDGLPAQAGIERLVHIDCYRIDNAKELLDLGLNEILADPKNLVVIEWAERMAEYLPLSTIHLTFEITGESERVVKISN